MKNLILIIFAFFIGLNIVQAQDFKQLGLKELYRYPKYGIYVYESQAKFNYLDSVSAFNKLPFDETGHFQGVFIFLNDNYKSLPGNVSKQEIIQNIKNQSPFLSYSKTLVERVDSLQPYIQEVMVLYQSKHILSRDNFTPNGKWNIQSIND